MLLRGPSAPRSVRRAAALKYESALASFEFEEALDSFSPDNSSQDRISLKPFTHLPQMLAIHQFLLAVEHTSFTCADGLTEKRRVWQLGRKENLGRFSRVSRLRPSRRRCRRRRRPPLGDAGRSIKRLGIR